MKKSHTYNDEALFYVDVEGEGFVPAVEEEFADCAINVKDTQKKGKSSIEKTIKLHLPRVAHTGNLSMIRRSLTPSETALHKETVLRIGKFIYNSIAVEDFCISFDVERNSKKTEDDLSEISDVSSVQSDSDIPDALTNSSPSRYARCSGPAGPRKVPRTDNAAYMNKDFQSNSRIDRQHDLSVAQNHIDDVTMTDNSDTRPKTKSLDIPQLCGITRKLKNCADVMADEPATMDVCGNDGIQLQLDMQKLTNTVTDIEHVQMCSSVPFRRLFRISKENLSQGLLNAGKRYFLSGDGKKTVTTEPSHKAYLAHLYRRKRSVCFFCGFLTCPRTENSKQRCEAMRCTNCSFKHKGGRNGCKDKRNMVEYYHRTNDWRSKRTNPWFNMSKQIKMHLRCFNCNKPGEANMACRGVSCPKGIDTLDYRCLELLGKQSLHTLVRQKPQMFKHLRDRHLN
uniref:Uncharacterized protein n=1 Tax=Babesia bovis TaxID=5865 RepID=S6BLX1_BABBO|nr:hypothetical protein [Babesia bovis]